MTGRSGSAGCASPPRIPLAVELSEPTFAGSTVGAPVRGHREQGDRGTPPLHHPMQKQRWIWQHIARHHACNRPSRRLTLAVDAQCFDWDYAPASELCGSRRVYFNVSQEGSADVETLQELNLVRSLFSQASLQPSNADAANRSTHSNSAPRPTTRSPRTNAASKASKFSSISPSRTAKTSIDIYTRLAQPR